MKKRTSKIARYDVIQKGIINKGGNVTKQQPLPCIIPVLRLLNRGKCISLFMYIDCF